MSAIIGTVLGMIIVFGAIFGVCKVAETVKPSATVGEVGPWILGILVLVMLACLALISIGG